MANRYVVSDFIPTPDQITRHTRACKICNLQPEMRYDINKMLLEGAYDSKIISYAADLGIYITPSNVSNHKKYLNYIAEDDLIHNTIDKVVNDNELHKQYLTEKQEEITRMYAEVQDAKQDQLLKLWTVTIPDLRRLLSKVNDNAMLPVKDYASAFETMLKCALLLEGKPTGKIAIDSTSNITSNGQVAISDIDKLSAIFGVNLNEDSKNN